MNKQEIRTILLRNLNIADSPIAGGGPWIDGIDAAAEAIAALPIDRVQAMAALTTYYYGGELHVPDEHGGRCIVDIGGDRRICNCGEDKCDHIKAATLYLERKCSR